MKKAKIKDFVSKEILIYQVDEIRSLGVARALFVTLDRSLRRS